MFFKKLFLEHSTGFALGITGVIFLLSSWPSPPQPPIEIPFYDKWAHLLMFTVVGICYLNATTRGFQQTTWVRAGLAFFLTSVYGALDEFHQSFVPGRYPDTHDWIADTVGGGIAVLVWWIFRTIQKQKRRA